MLVASDSGRTAVKAAQALKNYKIELVCVSGYAGIRKIEEKSWPSIKGEIREELKSLGVKILDETPYIFKDAAFDYQFLKEHTPSYIIHKFLSRALGYGFKTAIEIALLAADVGAVPIDQEIISIAGTGELGGGADCAIILKPSIIPEGYLLDLEKGLEVREIIALPRIKFSKRLIKLLKRKGKPI